MNDESPALRYAALSQDDEPAFIDRLMASALETPGLLSLAAGFTDNACMPDHLVRDAVADLVASGKSEVFQYGSNQGRPQLREAVIKLHRDYPGETKHDQLSAENVLISNGSQQSLYLALQTLCEPGDIVLVQEPSYFVFIEAARGMGIELVGLPCDPWGALKTDELDDYFIELRQSSRWARVKACYLVSYFANPSTHTMSLEEKSALGRAMLDQDAVMPTIEDAAYRDLYFKSDPSISSVLSVSEYASIPTLYLGTFTKPFSTGLKVGFGIFSDQGWLSRCARLKSHQDFGTSNFSQAVVEHLLGSDAWREFQKTMRQHYADKAQRFVECLDESGLRDMGWEWRDPEGGLLLWAMGPDSIDTSIGSAVFNAALEEKVLYVPGSVCMAIERPTATVRLSFGALNPEDFSEAIARFARAVSRL